MAYNELGNYVVLDIMPEADPPLAGIEQVQYVDAFERRGDQSA